MNRQLFLRIVLRAMVGVGCGWLGGVGMARAEVPKAGPGTAPKTVLLDGSVLLRARDAKDAEVLAAARAAADHALGEAALSVMDKTQTPPSGDKHDYMSLAPYFWPNPATPNHLPYVRKDGQHNPEASAVKDHEDFTKTCENVRALALGYYLTGDAAYAAKAAADLRVWFLDAGTKMNPNLRFAQAVLGVNDGRGTGVLESRGLTDVVDGLVLLEGAKAWTAADEAGMQAWMEAYFTWLTTSDNGKAEAAAKNNHGSWDDVQVGTIGLWLGKVEFVKALVETAKTKRVGLQIQADGQMPMEEARTKSFGYCVFDLTALMQLATLAGDVGVDLWGYAAPGGGSIRRALDYLLPFAKDPKAWGHEDILGMHVDGLREPLLRAAVAYREPGYEAAAGTLGGHAKGGGSVDELLLMREYGLVMPPNAAKGR